MPVAVALPPVGVLTALIVVDPVVAVGLPTVVASLEIVVAKEMPLLSDFSLKSNLFLAWVFKIIDFWRG
jgi:hypothetical protein